MAKSMFLTPKKAARIHELSLVILEKTGVRIDHPEAVDLLMSAGAKKDPDDRYLLSRRMIDEALEKVNKKVALFDREGNRAMLLKPGKTYFGTGSDALYNVDRKTGKVRLSDVSDIRDNVRIIDSLPNFDFVMSTALPHELEPATLYAEVFIEMVKNTTKPIVATATNLTDIRQIHAIASIVAGGAKALREKPFFIAYLEPNSPLATDFSCVERLLYCAENGIPFLFAAGANIGVAAPITLSAAVAQGNAESLFGLTLATLKNEDVRFIHGSNSSSVDMHYGKVLYGAPEWFKTVAMYADMGRYYHLPTWGTGGCSDAWSIDAQAGFEAYEGILLAVQSGPTLVHDVGFLSYGFLYDARMIVLADEIISRARHLTEVIDVTDDRESMQAIDEVVRGRLGYYSFLDHPHTAQYFRKTLWLPPPYMERRMIALDAAEPNLREELSQAVQNLLITSEPAPLSQKVASDIDHYFANLPQAAEVI
jgi:trimethylamine--corrinoid protein Co-methyltransferase